MPSFIRAQMVFPHGLMEKAWAPRWKTETRWFQTHLRKTTSKHRLLQNKDGACLRLIRLVCATASLSVSARLTEADGSGLPLDVFSEFSRLSQLRLSTPCFCEHSPVWSFSQSHCGMPRHTCCCRPISSPPEGSHLFRPGRSSSWDFSFDFMSVFSSLIRRNSGHPGCSL